MVVVWVWMWVWMYVSVLCYVGVRSVAGGGSVDVGVDVGECVVLCGCEECSYWG